MATGHDPENFSDDLQRQYGEPYVAKLRRSRDELQRALRQTDMGATTRAELTVALGAIQRAIQTEEGA